jgi:hypothetical protein
MKFMYKAPLVCALMISAASMLSTGCKTYDDVATRYTSKHIKTHTNHVTAEVAEANELGFVLFALTDAGSSDNQFLNKNTAYYNEVTQHFAAFKNHKAVRMFNEDLKKDITNFDRFRNGLYAFKINERNDIVLKTDYRIDLNRMDFRRYMSAMQDFMEKSNFRDFYAKHQAQYSKLVDGQTDMLTMNAAWATISKHYKKPFKSYQVVISPLMKGEAKTLAIGGGSFNECIIFAESPSKALMYSATKSIADEIGN